MGKSTIAAIATGMSQSGIGIIRISGDDSFDVALKIFKHKNGSDFNSFDSHRVYYGFIYDNENPVDEILLIAMKGPKSFTGENVIELQCHGGIFLLNKILDIVIKNGARLAYPGEFSKRAFLNGRIDLSSAESVMDIISSKNEMSLSNSVKHLRGRLYDKILDIRSKLLYDIAFIEAAIDDPEHYDLTDYSEKLKINTNNLISDLIFLSNSFNDGRVLSEGVRTVILGKPNVGKSSFLNFISESDRAIVTDVAGTTRDIIEENIEISGINLKLVDTAGIHDSSDLVEKIGIDKAIEQAKNADLIVMILDSSIPISEEDIRIFEIIKASNAKSVILFNKSDLGTVASIDDVKEYINSQVITFSSKTGEGYSSFKKFINDSFLSGSLKYNDQIFISNLRQKEALDNSINSLNKVIDSINLGLPEDFYTIDLTDAYTYLGYIIGEETSEDVINEVFKKFCMGK